MEANTEHGSVLFLVPVITLIAMCLIGLLIDTAYLYYVKQRLMNVTLSCALGATNQISPQSFYTTGILTLNGQEAIAASSQCLASQQITGETPGITSATTQGTTLTLSTSIVAHPPLFGSLFNDSRPLTLGVTVSAKESRAGTSP